MTDYTEDSIGVSIQTLEGVTACLEDMKADIEAECHLTRDVIYNDIKLSGCIELLNKTQRKLEKVQPFLEKVIGEYYDKRPVFYIDTEKEKKEGEPDEEQI